MLLPNMVARWGALSTQSANLLFQAEDGIRYHCVTGVQTCALPIWKPWKRRLKSCDDGKTRISTWLRSEERRVGKECRVRGSVKHYNKKLQRQVVTDSSGYYRVEALPVGRYEVRA